MIVWLQTGAVAQALATASCWTVFPTTGGPLAGPNTDINSIDHGISASRNHRIPKLRRGSWGYNRRRCSIAATAMSEGRAQGTIDTPPRVLGLGSAGVDFIAAVDRYPSADDKVRTQALEVMGGGNCGNTLCAASRLGLDAVLATKVGSDANGRLILQGLEEEGVDVSRVVVSDATPSAFTYIIVDKEGGTRTCLHTPQTEDILPEEITPKLLDGVAVVHLDSRHTQAAVVLATYANQRNIPVVLDAEKDRPFLRDLLPLADFIICNRNFPQAFTGRFVAGHEAAIQELLEQGRARLVATTLGADGCIVVTRDAEQPWLGYGDLSLPDGCPMDVNTFVTSDSDPSDSSSAGDSPEMKERYAPARYVRASSWPIESSDVVDTTGAGDCFMAGFIYGLSHRLGVARTLALASLVAARKLSSPGARHGVPYFAQLQEEWPGLLAPEDTL
ncbi:unnamed protein product [Pylaiella littoralis]